MICGKIRQKMPTLNISEGSNTIVVVFVHLIHLSGYLIANLNAFLQKLLDILIQIFTNLQSFQWSCIAMIAAFSISAAEKEKDLQNSSERPDSGHVSLQVTMLLLCANSVCSLQAWKKQNCPMLKGQSAQLLWSSTPC